MIDVAVILTGLYLASRKKTLTATNIDNNTMQPNTPQITDLRGIPNLPRGLRNNNPGNLVQTGISWLGKVPLAQNTDSRFEQFISVQHGIRAMALDLYSDITKKGQNTIEKLIYAYAPPSENNTQNYINTIAQRSGIDRNAILQPNFDTLNRLILPMIVVENGNIANSYISPNMVAYSVQWALQNKPAAATIAGVENHRDLHFNNLA